jgi:glycine cleavage system H protein
MDLREVNKMSNPKELKYSKEHEWVKVKGDVVTIGITDFAQEQLTDVVFVELPDVGKSVTKEKQCAIVESVKSVSDVFAPINGEVIEINSVLKDKPEVINDDPYGRGWMVKIKMSDIKDLDDLMSASDYDKFLKETKH